MSNLRRRLVVALIFAAAVSAAGIDIDALICKFWTRCLRVLSKIAPSAASFDKRSVRTWLD